MSTKGAAVRILQPVPPDRAFYFYSEIGKSLGAVASSLKEFGTLLKTVEGQSLEFHTNRGDFENWVFMLGDGELARGLARLKEGNMKGEKLRAELVRVVQTRIKQLQKGSGSAKK
jgi:hypothetical protein